MTFPRVTLRAAFPGSFLLPREDAEDRGLSEPSLNAAGWVAMHMNRTQVFWGFMVTRLSQEEISEAAPPGITPSVQRMEKEQHRAARKRQAGPSWGLKPWSPAQPGPGHAEDIAVLALGSLSVDCAGPCAGPC